MCGAVDQVQVAPRLPQRGGKLSFGMIADVDPALDFADSDLRRREFRWPLLPSLAVIVGMSAGLWLAIFAIAAHLTART